MPRFTTIFIKHKSSLSGMRLLLKNVRIIVFSVTIAWMPPFIIYEFACKLGEAGFETQLTLKALQAEKTVPLTRRSSDVFVNRFIHEIEEMFEFYRHIR